MTAPRTRRLYTFLLLVPALLTFLAATFAQRPAAPVSPPLPQTPPTGAKIGAASQIHPPRPGYAFPTGETYVYTAEWRLWTAGTALLTMSRAGSDLQVNGSADSTGFVSVLYKVQDRFRATVDGRTFCSLSVFKHTEEGSHRRETNIHFDYARGKSTLDERNLKTGETKHVEHDIPVCTTDVLSGVYYLSTLALPNGASYTFPLSDGGQSVDVRAEVEAREDVKTPAGVFHTVRVSALATSGTLKDKGRLWIWFTDDARHMPVQIRSRLFWGTLTFRLIRADKEKQP